MNKRKTFKPRILVIGAGNFGKEHLDIWQRIAREGQVELAGAVVTKEQKRHALESQYGIPVFVGLDVHLLKQVEAVDIVTPSPTHFSVARQCLPHVHVLLEKPLGMTQREVQALERCVRHSRHVLMVNHVYRFHPVTEALQKLVKATRGRPHLILGSFLNPVEPGIEKYSVNLEFLHYFDIVDHLFGLRPESFSVEGYAHVNEVSLRYPGGMNVVLELGWKGSQRVRTLEIEYPDKKLTADFRDNTVVVLQRDRHEKTLADLDRRPLEAALRRFVQAIQGRRVFYPDARVGARIVDVALSAMPGPRKSQPRAVVVGGGIFGASCAFELARHCEVVLAERHSELLTEASFNNQLRHHSGFHYPRSLETVQEILSTRADFDLVYSDAVLRSTVSYYCTSAAAKEITGERYLAFCKENRLPFSIENPAPGLLDLRRASLCLRTDELVLDIPRLREMVHTKLGDNPRIETLLDTEVADAHITPKGQKVLRLKTGRRIRREAFDYLINATYANSNLLAKWFGFPVRRLRFDLCELLVLEIPMPNVSITILDAPFMSLMSTGRDNIFLFYQVQDGFLKSAVTGDGLPPNWGSVRSNRVNMMKHGTEFLPILREARYLESRYGTRVVTAYSEDYDGRPTVVTRHGFGCWSVLGGKIATCVSNAREIVGQIFPEATTDVAPAGTQAVGTLAREPLLASSV